jgi:hypothetical protein
MYWSKVKFSVIVQCHNTALEPIDSKSIEQSRCGKYVWVEKKTIPNQSYWPDYTYFYLDFHASIIDVSSQ